MGNSGRLLPAKPNIVNSINCIWVAVAGLLVPDFIYNIGTTVLNGGISMVIFFFVNKINMTLDIDTVSESGGRLGCGTILVIDDRNCIVDIVRNNLDFFRGESCGKCTPCREGGTRLYQLVSKIAEGRGTIHDLRTIEELADTMRLTALCGLGHSTAVPVLSSIQNFYPCYLRHIDKEPCRVCMQEEDAR